MTKDTKTALLDAAERAVRSRGFDGFSYADLSEDVGIRKASIHYHFSTKAELSAALMKRYRETLQSACEEIEGSSLKAAEQLSKLIEIYRLAMSEGDSLCLCVAFIGSRESLSPAAIDEITEFRKMVLNVLTRTFERGRGDGSISNVQDPRKEAQAALSLMEGAQLSARAQEEPAVFDNALALLLGRLS